jgi:glycosyltransferase involved in cell wall biosynthesis
MMYADVHHDFEITYASSGVAAELAKRERVIFHLHWEDAVFRTVRPDCAHLVMAEFVSSIDRLRRQGGRFVWTMHNLEPHDVVDRDLSAAFAQQLMARADLIHVHSVWAGQRLRPFVPATTPIVVVEHPSYVGCYPLGASRAEARSRLGLQPEDTVFLCLGHVRRYKGIERLLNTAEEFVGRGKFVIAGRSGRYDPRGSPPENCICIDGYVEDQTVSDLYAAADFAVTPCEEMTSSGSLLLALSFGVPVIAPECEETKSLVRDGREGFLYPPGEARGLLDAIEKAVRIPDRTRRAMARAASAAVAFRPPDAFAAEIRNMFAEQASWKHDPPAPRHPFTSPVADAGAGNMPSAPTRRPAVRRGTNGRGRRSEVPASRA